VTAPGDEEQYRRHFRGLSGDVLPAFGSRDWALRESAQLAEIERRLTYVTQETPEGYGHAVYCSREFVGGEPFLLLLGDHVYISAEQVDGKELRCSRQVLRAFEREGATVSAVKRTPEDMLHLRDRPGPTARRAPPVRGDGDPKKPTRSTPRNTGRGLRRGECLCFFDAGVHADLRLASST
jgi:UTP--glucose-1-phosphate uridylyltransferase